MHVFLLIRLLVAWFCFTPADALHCLSHDDCGENAACMSEGPESKVGRCNCLVGFVGNGLRCIENANVLPVVAAAAKLGWQRCRDARPQDRQHSRDILAQLGIDDSAILAGAGEPLNLTGVSTKAPHSVESNKTLLTAENGPFKRLQFSELKTDPHNPFINLKLKSEGAVISANNVETSNNHCADVECTFEQGPCHYRNVVGSEWGVLDGAYVKDGVVLINQAAEGAAYGLATFSGSDKLQTLMSPTITSLTPGILRFRFFQLTPNSALSLCINIATNCIWQTTSLAAVWQEAEISLPAGRYQFIFVAHVSSAPGCIGLDDITFKSTQLTEEKFCEAV